MISPAQWRWNYFFAGGADLTSDVATDFRVWGRIHDLKTYLPPKFCFSSVQQPLDVVNVPTKHFLGIFLTKDKKFLWVDPLGYKKRGSRPSDPRRDAPAPDNVRISLPVNSAIVPLINKGSVSQYREIHRLLYTHRLGGM